MPPSSSARPALRKFGIRQRVAVIFDLIGSEDHCGAFGKALGAGTVAAASAIYLSSRYAAQPGQVMVAALFTDSLVARR